jgi:hypothetical protein
MQRRVLGQLTVIEPYKSAFLDLRIATQRLTAARDQIAKAWAQVQGSQSSETSSGGNLRRDADDLQNRLNDLTNKVRRAWTEPDDR